MTTDASELDAVFAEVLSRFWLEDTEYVRVRWPGSEFEPELVESFPVV